MSVFKKAERKSAKLKLAVSGPSGSGKTFSALRLATGLGGRIAVIDTENDSASLYSDRFSFDVLTIDPPYSNEKYLDAIQASITAGYDVLIVDSLTHQWAGEGGLLNKKEQMDARGGNSFANWAKMTPEHEKFKNAILHADIHIIGTLRSKQDYVMETGSNGKQAPKKVGLAPIQRDGMEYEFTTVFDVAMNHEAQASKDRTGLFVDKIFQITEETGKTLAKWLAGGAPVLPKTQAPIPAQEPAPIITPIVTPAQDISVVKDATVVKPNSSFGESSSDWKATQTHLAAITDAGAKSKWTSANLKDYMIKRFGKDRLGLYSRMEYELLLAAIRDSSFDAAMVAAQQTGMFEGDVP